MTATPSDKQCWCLTCRPQTISNMRFVVCPDCGNKRCPKANDHRNDCTNSNDVGQKGSSWEHVAPRKKQCAHPTCDCKVPCDSWLTREIEKEVMLFGPGENPGSAAVTPPPVNSPAGGEPPQRRAVELPDLPVAVFCKQSNAGVSRWYYSDDQMWEYAITYAEQVAAERVRSANDIAYRYQLAAMDITNQLRAAELELAAEKQRADSLAVRVRELEANDRRYRFLRDERRGPNRPVWLERGRKLDKEIDEAILAESEGEP